MSNILGIVLDSKKGNKCQLFSIIEMIFAFKGRFDQRLRTVYFIELYSLIVKPDK